MKRSSAVEGHEEEDGILSSKMVKMGGSITSSFTCPVCQSLYKDAVMLDCGHGLCHSCQFKIKSGSKKACPECQVEILPTKVTTPAIPVRKFMATLPNEKTAVPIGETCLHVGCFADSADKCPHCEQMFCPVCMLCHMDRIQLDMKWLHSSFEPRLSKSGTGLEQLVRKAKKVISSRISEARAHVAQETEELVKLVKQRRTQLMGELDAYEVQQNGFIDRFLEKSKGVRNEVKNVGEMMNGALGTSLLLCSPKQIGDVKKAIIDVDHKIFRMEHFQSNFAKFSCQVDFETAKENVKDVQIKRCNFGFPSLKDQSTEAFRLEEAIASESVAKVKRFYETRPAIPHTARGLLVNGKLLDAPTATDGGFEVYQQDECEEPEIIDVKMEPVICDHGQQEQTPSENCVPEKNVKPSRPTQEYPITPLIRAAETGNVDVVRFLVETCGADILKTQGSGETAIHTAARFDRVDALRYLLQKLPRGVWLRDNFNSTPLHIAAANGSIVVVKYLVEAEQANILEERDSAGSTPLMTAVIANDVGIVKYFIEKAKVNPGITAPTSGKTVIHLAVNSKSTDVLKYLAPKFPELVAVAEVKFGCSITHAVLQGYLEGFRILAESNMTYLKSLMSTKFIHCAAISGNVDIGRIFIEEYGATVLNHFQGGTPLHYATEHNRPDFVSLLLETEPAIKNIKRSVPPCETPIEFARSRGLTRIERMLRDA